MGILVRDRIATLFGRSLVDGVSSLCMDEAFQFTRCLASGARL